MQNLRALGVQHLAACDPDQERLAPMVEALGIQAFTDLDAALEATNPTLVFICTPPVLHIPQALQAVRSSAHVFIEKPLSHSLDGIDELIAASEQHQRVVQVGYNLRFEEGVCALKSLLEDGAIGRVLWAYAEVGQYLPDWRPWQDYRASYTARRELGGGIILDASHELDYILWLLGQPEGVLCMAGRVSNLDVNVEDCATILLRFAEGMQAVVHMDFVQRRATRTCKLVGEHGTLLWDAHAQQVQLFRAESQHPETHQYQRDSNAMYQAEVLDFLKSVDQMTPPRVDVRQARQVLATALAARQVAEQTPARILL
jgi:predicted dehydrogenase